MSKDGNGQEPTDKPFVYVEMDETTNFTIKIQGLHPVLLMGIGEWITTIARGQLAQAAMRQQATEGIAIARDIRGVQS